MNVLLTGATGFLGINLTKAFLDDGHELICLKRRNSSLGRLHKYEKEIRFYDLEEVGPEQIFKKNPKVEVVVHCATSYGRAGESVPYIFNTNTVMPLRILSSALTSGVHSFINTDTVLQASVNAYSLSKSQFKGWGKLMSDPGGLRFLNLRLEHMYGPGDDPSKFTTWIVRQCLRNISPIPLSAGTQKRDFVYIDDVVAAYRLILNRLEAMRHGFHEYDLGSGRSLEIREFVKQVHDLTQSDSKLEFGTQPTRQHDLLDSFADISALKELGWQPACSLDEGLKYLVESEREVLIKERSATPGAV